MKKILFLGYLIPPDETSGYKGVSAAGNKMQWDLVKNLAADGNIDVTCVSVSPRASFPREKKLWEKSSSEKIADGVTLHKVPFCNIRGIKQVWQIFSVYLTAEKLMKKQKFDTLLCFNMFPPIGIPMRWLKKKFRGTDTVCLLADLPIDDDTNRKGISKLLMDIFDRSAWKSMEICTRYIVLNKNVIDRYLPSNEYIVVEGGVDEGDIPEEGAEYSPAERSVLFCGALTEYNGIPALLEAMEELKDTDIVLDIYGGGYLEDEVKRCAAANPNIRFHGSVPRDVMIRKQREAWLLINPRDADDPISQVTFPSKMFEYMLSGVPAACTRLNCFGSEYEDCLLWIDDGSGKGIAESIRKIRDMSESDMKEISRRAREMITEKKLWSAQCKRIAEFLYGR